MHELIATFPGPASARRAPRQPPVNERVELDGHYLIVIGSTGDVRVSCPWCGLRYLAAAIGAGSNERIADALVGQALARFADKSCDGVRLELLAAEVMES